MNSSRSLFQKILVDILGILMIIGSILFGWIPGPGGIPLLLGGLGLLATNHLWAKKILVRLQRDGLKIMDKIFVDHKAWVITYDIIVGLLLILGFYLLVQANRMSIRSVAIVIIFLGVGIFLGNRKRYKKFSKKN